jgi:hypothetical protein
MLKTVSSITNAIGALNYKGTWNANTNTPTLVSGAGTKGDYYQVSVAGSTALDGISNWGVGDVVAFNGTSWQRIEGGADLNGVNLSVSGTSTLSALTASTSLGLDANKNIVSLNVPAFSAYQNSAQSIPATTDTKLLFQAEEFDTNSNFASSRFAPTVAGYYQLTGGVRYSSGAVATYLSFLKNGSTSKRTFAPLTTDQFYGSVLMYFNGTTDYVEMWVYALGAATCDASASSTYFQGVLVRAA